MCQIILTKSFWGEGEGPVFMYKIYRIFPRSIYNNRPLFFTKHSIKAPLIWRLIGLINLSESVAEGSEDTSFVY
jgi:hypothetical protein